MPKGEPLPVAGQTLYVVATPIGNLRDITLRALDVLGQVDVIAAEDTRVTGALTAHYGITARLLSLHQHNERGRADEIVALLGDGKCVAIVTDAGTPGISDPGALLVRAVAAAGFAVVAIPGASAVVAALSVSGIIASRWLFCGFLPASAGARRSTLEKLRDLPFALVFYEAPHRVAEAIRDLDAILGPDREVVTARELTKKFETVQRGRLDEVAKRFESKADSQRGEFVLIVDVPPPRADVPVADADDTVLLTLLAELPLAQSVRIAMALTGSPKNRLYTRALALQAVADDS